MENRIDIRITIFNKTKSYVKTPTVFQMEATECGAASLSMIFAYYGKEIPLEQMRIETGVSRDGSKASNIVRAAKRLGLKAKGYRYSLRKLVEEASVPCVIHWNFNHFVVFEGKKGKYYYLNDPAGGRRKLTKEELDQGYTGITIQFKRGPGFQKERQKRTLLRFIQRRLEGQTMAVVSLLVIGLFLVVPGIMMPVFSEVFIDDILIGQTTSWFMQFLILMGATIAFQAFFTYLKSALLLKLQNKLALVSAHKFISHMLRLPMAFYDQRNVGDLSGRVENNNNVSMFLAGDLGETILNIFVSCFYLILLLLYSPLLTLIGVAGAAVNILLMMLSASKLEDMSKKMQQDTGKMYGVFYTGVSITSTLKASGAENEYVGRIIGNYGKVAEKSQEMSRTQEILNSIPEISKNTTNVLVLMAGGILVIGGSLSVGQLVAYTSLLGSFIVPINSLVGFIQKIQTMKTDMGRVEDIQNYKIDLAKDKGQKKVPLDRKLSGNVDMNDVSFGYSILEKPLVENFSFHLTAGRSIAFVGASGSGKSTVSKILSGLYQPWSGEVLLDGIPMNQIPPEVLSISVSTVSQQVMLFSGTIRDNLTMWNRHILESDIIKAAKDACIHDVITRKPGAYDYVLAEGGSNLSGGQRQRLEIARALVTSPSVLIMDEATSALDPLVEKEIVDNIKRRGCTCVIVAHRLSAIRDCDEILVMDNGRIVQRGTHEELAKQEGHYQRLIKNI